MAAQPLVEPVVEPLPRGAELAAVGSDHHLSAVLRCRRRARETTLLSLAPGTVAKDRPVEGLAFALVGVDTCSITRHDCPASCPGSRSTVAKMLPAGSDGKAACDAPETRNPLCKRASRVRPGRLELPRGKPPTRPSTLRVYQFRHRRVCGRRL